MKIVIPMAGKGSRFLSAAHLNPEFLKPKPLINLLGKPMMQRSLESVKNTNYSQLIFIVRQDHQKDFQIAYKLHEMFGREIKVIYTDGITKGAACTVLLAKNYINNLEDILIMDIDHYFKANLDSFINQLPLDVKGFLLVHQDDNPKWSFTKVDDNGMVVEIAEKNPISKWANVGAYYYSQGSDFVWAAEEMIKKGLMVNGEYYVAPVYNQLLEKGYKLTILPVEQMWEMGTPDDFDFFEKNFKDI